jgi:succinate dehydrogenase/fumarate reductase flavoprotein subunit
LGEAENGFDNSCKLPIAIIVQGGYGMASKDVQTHECDVLVIGGGLAGCFAAIKAKEADANKVIQIDKGKVGKSGQSAFAAGIIKAFCPEEDDFDWAFKLIIEGVHYLVDQERLENHLTEVWERVKDLESYGAEFERDKDGKILRFPGRGNILNVMFHGGNQLMTAVAKAARERGVEQINKTMMTDLLTQDGRLVGAVAFNILNGEFHLFKAKATVLATGTVAYKGRPPGVRDDTGDGVVAAYRAGADVTNADTAYILAYAANYDIGTGMHMYQGTGAKWVNAKGEAFMEKYYPELKDRADIPILTFAFGSEVRQGNGPIYCDMTHFTKEQVQRLKRVIPLPMRMYEKVGLVKDDKFISKIEWMIASNRTMMGPLPNTRFETCLPGLYICGDSMPCTGFEGGERGLAGASTSGARAGRFAAEFAKSSDPVKVNNDQVKELRRYAFQPLERKDGIEPDQVILSLLEAVVPYDVFLIQDGERLKKALEKVERIRDNEVPLLFAYDPHYLRMALEAQNLVTCAEMQLRAAYFREESRLNGGIREDFPYTDNENWLKWVSLWSKNNKMTIKTQDLHIDRFRVKPPRDIVLDRRWQLAKDLNIIKIEKGKVKWV